VIAELQGAVYQRLKTLLPVAVYDDVPSQASFPYVVVGEDIVSDYSTKERFGGNVLIAVHVFSLYRGMKEVKEIAEQVLNALKQGVEVNGVLWCYSGLDTMRFLVEDDGVRHGVVQMRFKILTEV